MADDRSAEEREAARREREAARRERTGLDKKVAGTDARCAGKSPGSVTRSMQAQLFRRIRVQEVGLQNTIIDDHSAARGHALAVEGT